mmetsp:Transcript_10267/g.24586  ORF Transcript_10267/g.24586 Transcript_10267/m.24586 type:complete len:375 (-) Transcript_10267:1976-3100(-)
MRHSTAIVLLALLPVAFARRQHITKGTFDNSCKPEEAARPHVPGPWETEQYDSIAAGDINDGLYCGGLDICFAIDESESMGYENFGREIIFTRRLISRLVQRMHPDYPANYSAWLFDGTSAGADQLSGTTTDWQQVLAKVNMASYDGGCTSVAEALKRCNEEWSTNPNGNRVLVLVSDGGQSVDANGDGKFIADEEDAYVLNYAQQMKDSGVSILALELYWDKYGRNSILTNFLTQLVSRREDGSARLFSKDFESVLENDIVVADIMAGAEGACDPEIVGEPPVTECRCKEVEITSGERLGVRKVPGSEHQIDGVSRATCVYYHMEPRKVFECDLEGDRICKIHKKPSWTPTGHTNPIPNEEFECEEMVRTVTE